MKKIKSAWNYIVNEVNPFLILGIILLFLPILSASYNRAVEHYHHPTVEVYYDNGKKEVYPDGHFDDEDRIIYSRNGRTKISVPKTAKVVVKYDK